MVGGPTGQEPWISFFFGSRHFSASQHTGYH